MVDVGILVVRLVVGLYLIGHGTQKLFGWFDGPGLGGTRGFMAALGFRPAALWAVNAALAETVGGVLLALGLLNPLASLAIGAAMLTAIFSVHWTKGVWATKGGYELPLTNLAVAAGLGLAGPGALSLDRMLGIALPEPVVGAAGAVLVLLGVLTAFASRRTERARSGQAATGAA